MESASKFKTRATLLGRLRSAPQDTEAWAEFVECYGGKVYDWCRAWGLQPADAQDVSQNVFLMLTSRLQHFQYEPTGCFRAWLKTVTHHAWQDYMRKWRRDRSGSGTDTSVAALLTLEAREDLSRRLMDAFDEDIYREAVARIRLRIEPRTWDAFQLLAIEGLSGAEAAHRLGMKVATVFVARSKVQHMLSAEIARLDRLN